MTNSQFRLKVGALNPNPPARSMAIEPQPAATREPNANLQTIPVPQPGAAAKPIVAPEPWDVETAAQLYQSGWSLRQLGDRHGLPASSVRSRLLNHGVATRRPGVQGRSDVATPRIRWLRDVDGLTWREIADRVTITLSGARARYLTDLKAPTEAAEVPWSDLFATALKTTSGLDVIQAVGLYLHRPPTPNEIKGVLDQLTMLETTARAQTVISTPRPAADLWQKPHQRRRRILVTRPTSPRAPVPGG